MAGGDRLVNCMRQAAKRANPKSRNTDIVYGSVQTVSPLTVLVDNRLELTEEFLILSPFCFKSSFSLTVDSHKHAITVKEISQEDHTHETKEGPTESAGGFEITPSASSRNAGGHVIDVTLWGDLEIGDRLVMLRVSEGQEYLVLYRDRLDIQATCQYLQ